MLTGSKRDGSKKVDDVDVKSPGIFLVAQERRMLVQKLLTRWDWMVKVNVGASFACSCCQSMAGNVAPGHHAPASLRGKIEVNLIYPSSFQGMSSIIKLFFIRNEFNSRLPLYERITYLYVTASKTAHYPVDSHTNLPHKQPVSFQIEISSIANKYRVIVP